jgi:protoheme IX farnesyltransferase
MIPPKNLSGAQYPLCPSSVGGVSPLPAQRGRGLFGLISVRAQAYLDLTKPTIQLLVVLTGAAALVYEGSFLSQPERFGLALLGLALSAGSAKALNQYFERHIDARMERTRTTRPLPRRLIEPAEAVAFALILGSTAVLIFGYFFSLFSALLAAATILFYSLFYTLYLKPRTPHSIVIGGIAGGMGPVLSWAATGSSISATPLLMLLVIFCWTPPHFWALAYCHLKDFKRVSYPMLPNVVSRKRFWRITWLWGTLTMIASLALGFVGAGIGYLAAAAIFGGIFLWQIGRAGRQGTTEKARGVFIFSMAYLVLLFSSLIADRIIQ